MVHYYLEHESSCKSDEFSVPSLRIQIRVNKSRMNSVYMDWFIGSRQAFIQSLGKHDLSCFGLSIGTSFAVKRPEFKYKNYKIINILNLNIKK